MRIYGLKNCDSCRAALRDLGAAGHAAVLVDLREAGLPDGLRDRALAQFGAALINRRSTTWKGLDESARGRSGRPFGRLSNRDEAAAD